MHSYVFELMNGWLQIHSLYLIINYKLCRLVWLKNKNVFFFMQKQHSKMVLIPSNQLLNLMDKKNNLLKENILYLNSC